MFVKDMMNKDVKIIRPDATVMEAAKIMNNFRIGSLVVVSGPGTVEGIITERDILTDIVAKGLKADKVLVEKIMTKKDKMIYVGPETTLDEAADLMSKHKIKKLPVIDKGELVGIVTASDLITYENKLIEKVSELLVMQKPQSIGG